MPSPLYVPRARRDPFLYQPPPLARALHPFPTRRSSDLQMRLPTKLSNLLFLGGSPGMIPNRGSHYLLSGKQYIIIRSEEHTSELQSLRQLVCRLLLEKKKQLRTKRPPALITRTSPRASR